MSAIAWIVEKWDWIIYRCAHHSIRRMCKKNQGFAYLFELWIREWRSQHPISKELESATEHFFESLRDYESTETQKEPLQ